MSYDMCQAAQRSASEYILIFIPWFWHGEYTSPELPLLANKRSSSHASGTSGVPPGTDIPGGVAEGPLLASRPGEFHPQALSEPCVNLSTHTAPVVRPLAHSANDIASSTGLLPLPVGSGPRLNNAAPSVQSHYRTFIPTTDCSAPVLRIGTLALAVLAA